MSTTLSRRRLIASSAAVIPLAAFGSGLLTGCSFGIKISVSPGFLDAVAEIVIPGARLAMVGEYMARAFEHGLFGSYSMTANTLEGLLDRRLKHSFMSSTLAERTKVIRDLDAEVFGKGASGALPTQTASGRPPSSAVSPLPGQLWRSAKSAIIVGFYMSETGASNELRYEPVPGRLDPDIPYKSGDTYLSNNWNANVG